MSYNDSINFINISSLYIQNNRSINQTLDNFQKLQSVFTKISSIIKCKNQKQKARIQNLNQRIKKCYQKINQLNNTKTAIKFISPSTYVKQYKFQAQTSNNLFEQFEQQIFYQLVDLKSKYQNIQNPTYFDKNDCNIQKKQLLIFDYHKLKHKNKILTQQRKLQKLKNSFGLGKMPKNIKFVQNILIQGTKINAYEAYKINNINNQNLYQNRIKINIKKQDNEVIQCISIQLVQPPPVFNQNMQKNTGNNENIRYKNINQNIPEIKFQSNLNLEGIVQNFQIDDFPDNNYKTSDNNFQISINSNVLQIEQQQQQLLSSAPSSQLPPYLQTFGRTQNNTKVIKKPPPPPPPPLQKIDHNQKNTKIIPPPPPPPPPPPRTIVIPENQIPVQLKNNQDRKNLMKLLNTENPIARLKKTITKQYQPFALLKKQTKIQEENENQKKIPLSHFQFLKKQLCKRFDLLNQQKPREEEEISEQN